MPFTGDGVLTSALLWLAAGCICGALFGALAGLLTDLFSRLTA